MRLNFNFYGGPKCSRINVLYLIREHFGHYYFITPLREKGSKRVSTFPRWLHLFRPAGNRAPAEKSRLQPGFSCFKVDKLNRFID